jgi:hypothetical protein
MTADRNDSRYVRDVLLNILELIQWAALQSSISLVKGISSGDFLLHEFLERLDSTYSLVTSLKGYRKSPEFEAYLSIAFQGAGEPMRSFRKMIDRSLPEDAQPIDPEEGKGVTVRNHRISR